MEKKLEELTLENCHLKYMNKNILRENRNSKETIDFLAQECIRISQQNERFSEKNNENSKKIPEKVQKPFPQSFILSYKKLDALQQSFTEEDIKINKISKKINFIQDYLDTSSATYAITLRKSFQKMKKLYESKREDMISFIKTMDMLKNELKTEYFVPESLSNETASSQKALSEEKHDKTRDFYEDLIDKRNLIELRKIETENENLKNNNENLQNLLAKQNQDRKELNHVNDELNGEIALLKKKIQEHQENNSKYIKESDEIQKLIKELTNKFDFVPKSKDNFVSNIDFKELLFQEKMKNAVLQKTIEELEEKKGVFIDLTASEEKTRKLQKPSKSIENDKKEKHEKCCEQTDKIIEPNKNNESQESKIKAVLEQNSKDILPQAKIQREPEEEKQIVGKLLGEIKHEPELLETAKAKKKVRTKEEKEAMKQIKNKQIAENFDEKQVNLKLIEDSDIYEDMSLNPLAVVGNNKISSQSKSYENEKKLDENNDNLKKKQENIKMELEGPAEKHVVALEKSDISNNNNYNPPEAKIIVPFQSSSKTNAIISGKKEENKAFDNQEVLNMNIDKKKNEITGKSIEKRFNDPIILQESLNKSFEKGKIVVKSENPNEKSIEPPYDFSIYFKQQTISKKVDEIKPNEESEKEMLISLRNKAIENYENFKNIRNSYDFSKYYKPKSQNINDHPLENKPIIQNNQVLVDMLAPKQQFDETNEEKDQMQTSAAPRANPIPEMEQIEENENNDKTKEILGKLYGEIEDNRDLKETVKNVKEFRKYRLHDKDYWEEEEVVMPELSNSNYGSHQEDQQIEDIQMDSNINPENEILRSSAFRFFSNAQPEIDPIVSKKEFDEFFDKLSVKNQMVKQMNEDDMNSFNEILASKNKGFQPVSNIKNLSEFAEEYKEQKIIDKIYEIKQKIECFREIKGEGNCFFRAIGFLFFENMILEKIDKTNFKSCQLNLFLDLLEKDEIKFIQFKHNEKDPEISNILENETPTLINILRMKLQEIFIMKLNHLDNNENILENNRLFTTWLYNEVNKNLTFDMSLILLIRSLIYPFYIEQKENPDFNKFMYDFEESKNCLQTYGKEAENCIVPFAAFCLNFKINIHILHDDQKKKEYSYLLEEYQIDEPKTQRIMNLFFRPGHYDVAYTKEFLKENYEENYYNH